MKKIMLTAAVAAAGLAFGIESANTVGYTTKTIEAGKYMMIAVQFDSTSNTILNADQAFSLDKAPASWVDPEEDDDCIPNWYQNAPCLKIPKGTVDMGYTDLYYTSNACDLEDGYKGKRGWANELGYLVKAPLLRNGYGVWIKAGALEDVTVTINGQVKAAASDSFTGGAGYNLLRLPYPVALNAGDSKIDWNLASVAPASWVDPEEDDDCIQNWFQNAPCLKIPKGTVDMGYTDLYYSSNACDLDDGYKGKPGWANELGFLVKNAVIPEGQGFWLVLPAATTVTQTK